MHHYIYASEGPWAIHLLDVPRSSCVAFRAVKAHRQPGSAFKPFVYLAAVEQGATPDTMVLDMPQNIGGWAPRNADRTYLGEITLTVALARSRNAATVRLAQDLGFDAVRKTFDRFSLPSGVGPTFVLGTEGTRLIDLTAAYATLAAGGRVVRPTSIVLILDNKGNVMPGPPPLTMRNTKRKRFTISR